jgi:FixJ family two-component response regulator
MKAPGSEEPPVVFIVDDDESLRDALVRLFRMMGLAIEADRVSPNSARPRTSLP